MKALLVSVLVTLALVSGAVPLSAHHSWPVNMSRLVTVKGTVTEFAWENPHPMMTLEVRTDDGKMEKWLVGGPALNRMEANGWTKMTVKPVDVITGTGYQFADGQKSSIKNVDTIINGHTNDPTAFADLKDYADFNTDDVTRLVERVRGSW